MFQDLTGQKFGYLSVLEFAYKKPRKNGGCRYFWRCHCLKCGNECVVAGQDLKSGKQISCGCVAREKLIERNTIHGMSGTKIYRNWHGMIERCENPHHKDYPNYGGRGIKVCERWLDFQNFYEDVSKLEKFGRAGYTLDRIDVDGDYCPENCRWVSRKEQSNNRRITVKIEYEGNLLTLPEIAEKTGIKLKTLEYRYRVGDRGERLFRNVKK